MRSILAVFLVVAIAVSTPVAENETVIGAVEVVEERTAELPSQDTSVVANMLEVRQTPGFDQKICVPFGDGSLDCWDVYSCRG
ncbi:hypothetical protein BKA62DRAFT_769180 [Auriculariales sp. MPI-PUGE-AT-0066]|nr:hypothetical protein BKA62DRAFT_769180 [Auriculariales sp. MPI-PUGE-AT-0066]